MLAAAATQWNSLPFRPGLVGGHCIGVDPYSLTTRAEQLGYQGLHGVLVSTVESGSAAEDAGLQRGALILQVNRHPVPSVQAFRHAIRSAKPGQKLLLLVRLGDGTQYLALEVPK